jgi:transposase
VSLDPEQAVIARLLRLRATKEQLQAEVAEVEAQIRQAVRLAVDQGLSYRKVGALMGVSQTAILKWLRANDAGTSCDQARPSTSPPAVSCDRHACKLR